MIFLDFFVKLVSHEPHACWGIVFVIFLMDSFLEFWLGDMVTLPNCWSPERSVAMLLLPMLFSAALL